MVVVAAIAFASIPKVETGPAGQVAGIVGKPGDAALRLSPSVAVAPTTAPVGGGEIGASVAGRHGSSDATSAPRSGQSTPGLPDATRRPSPAATPCLRVAPLLVGERRNDAPASWGDAGFSGPVAADEGHGNYLIQTQSRTAGREYPCDSGVTIGP